MPAMPWKFLFASLWPERRRAICRAGSCVFSANSFWRASMADFFLLSLPRSSRHKRVSSGTATEVSAAHRHIDRLQRLKVIGPGMNQHIVHRNTGDFHGGGGDVFAFACLFAHRRQRAEQIGNVESEDEIGFLQNLTRAVGHIERMHRRKIESAAFIDNGHRQQFGKLDQSRHRLWDCVPANPR